jgi:hypothetical protein
MIPANGRGKNDMSNVPRKQGVTQSAATTSSATDVSAFLEKVKAMPKQNGRGKLIFAMDATMSRQPTWDNALSIQSQMFMEAKRAGGLSVQLVYFRGFNECRASRWVDDPESLARLMTKVDCRGGNTQVARVLSHIKSEAGASKVSAVVYVGDAFEESIDKVCQAAGEIGLLGLPIFMFQEGTDAQAEKAFREISRLTRGAYFRLDSSAPSVLAELLSAVAAYASGGREALENKGGSAARALLQQLT